jgi:tetratricopeptide (TPR) repeat protein
MLVVLSTLVVLAGMAGCGKEAESPAVASASDPGSSRIRQLEEAVEQAPDDPRPRHALAVALHQAGRSTAALPHFEKLVETDPSAVRLVELGVAYLSVARAADAESAFQRALEAEPGQPVALHHLGNLAEARGDRPEAISLYRQAIENDPDYLIAHYHLAEALRDAGRLKDAYRTYEGVLDLQPRSAPELEAFDESLFQLGSLDLQMGATERAVELLKLLVEAAPEHPEAHGVLARAYSRLGREEEARRDREIHERLAASGR